jgi:hypothetical protein
MLLLPCVSQPPWPQATRHAWLPERQPWVTPGHTQHCRFRRRTRRGPQACNRMPDPSWDAGVCGLVGAVRAMTGWCTRLRLALPWAIGSLSPPPPQGTSAALSFHILRSLAITAIACSAALRLVGGPRPPAGALGRCCRGHQKVVYFSYPS